MSTILKIKVIPQARKNALKPAEDGWKVYLAAPAIEGKANEALIAFLAQHYGVRKRDVAIIKGLKSRFKIIKICI